MTRGLVAALALLAATAAQAQLTECRIPGMRNSVQCGVVRRALDPARPAGPAIDVHYVVVPAMARRKLPDPVFLLAGGPGQSAISVGPQAWGLFRRLNNRRDIVFVDQRGTGRSAPLECEDAKRETLAERSSVEQQIRQLMACKATLAAKPYVQGEHNLGFFTTPIAVQDLDAVREQLGAQRVDLVGISYGTRVGLEYMRQFPTRVRRSVLDSVAPPDMALPTSLSTDSQAALDALLAACDAQPGCHGTYPKLRADWEALLRSLPRPVSAAQPLTGKVERFTLTREMVLGAVRGALYMPSTAAALPATITEAADGKVKALVGVGALLTSRKGVQLAMGMHLSVVCAEDVPRITVNHDAPGADFRDDQAALYERACAQWPRGAVPAAFYTIPRTVTPTLLLSGGIDPVTPPRHGARVAAALGRAAQHVIVPNAGHGVLAVGCARDLLYRFIDTADDAAATALDTACVKAIPRPGVFIPMSDTPGASP